MAGKGGGAWKVAYADFVTAMMAFFMVMWLTSQNEDIKEAIAHHFEDPFSFNDPHDMASSPGKSNPAAARNVSLPKKPDKLNKKDRRTHRPTILTLGQGNKTTTGTIIFFPEHSPVLTEAAKGRLDELIPSLLGKPQRLEIRGHASRRPLPADSPCRDAWQLSYARCLATMQYLEQHGIAAERMRLSQAGVYEPYQASGGDKLAQQERVEVQLLNEVLVGAIAEEPPHSAQEPVEHEPPLTNRSNPSEPGTGPASHDHGSGEASQEGPPSSGHAAH